MIGTALIWALAAICLAIFCVWWARLARAEPPMRCVQLHPGALVFTTQGVSVTLGEDNATVAKGDVRYHDGPPLLCMPAKGMLRLYLPSRAWPAFAMHSNDELHRYFDQFRDEGGTICCGLADCPQLADVAEEKGGYRFPHPWAPHEHVFVPIEKRKPSPDGHFYACFRADRSVRCFFGPLLGS